MYGDVDFMLSIWNVSASNANSFVQHLFYVHVMAFLCIQNISSRLHSFPYSLVQNIKIHWISFLHHSYCKTNINSTVIIWKDIQMWEFISRCQCISVSVFSSWVCLSRFQIYIHTYHTHTAHESTAFHLIITSECLIALKIILCIANSSIFKHSKWLNGKWQI